MAKKIIEPDAEGKFRSVRVPSGASHTLVLRRMELDHRYHDDEPVHDADFVVQFPNGFELKGKLDANGKATLVGVPASGKVRYAPDARELERADTRENPDHRSSFSDADFDTLFAKYRSAN